MKRLLFVLCLLLSLCCLFVACDEEGAPTPTPEDVPQNEEQNGGEPEEHTHAWCEWETTTVSTCGTKGEKKRTCSCGESETQPIPALGGCVYNRQNICSACNTALQYTDGLEYILNEDQISYTVKKGTALNKTTDVALPCYYNEKPVTVIGKSAFSDGDLTSISIPSTVTTIAEDAFRYCRKIGSIYIPKSVTTIEEDAFRGCYALIEVCNSSFANLENTYLTEYAQYVYADQKDIPQREFFTDQNGYMFYFSENSRYLISYTGNETTISLPENCRGNDYEIYPYVFRQMEIVSVHIPSAVTAIGDWAFGECNHLENVTFSQGSRLERIGEVAFGACCFSTFVIPASVAFIDKWAFVDCDDTTIIFENKNGWWITEDKNATAGTIVNVEDSTNNGIVLESTYADFYWRRTQT